MSSVAIAETTTPLSAIQLARLDAADALHEKTPVTFLVAGNVLKASLRDALVRDFPRYREAGFFEHDPELCGPTINLLIAEIRSPAFAAKLGEKLDLPDLSSRPQLVHLSARQDRRHGTIHTDSGVTLATVLFYFNADWPYGSAGCLRFLGKPDDINAMIAPEVKPLYGTMVAFRRSAQSFHGYLPYEGERRVIKAAWLVDEAAFERKSRRARTTHAVKKLLGPLDRWFDAGRDDSKPHKG